MHNSDEERSAGFLTLPYELYRRIFSDLEPFVILQLSELCTHLHEVLSNKDIWKEVLRRLCRREHLFEPSFPIEEMGLEDLQRASVGPTVWKNKVHRHAALGVDSPLPFVEQAFGGDFEPGNRMRTAFHYVHFIPGGRYLISTSEMLITLWDLGPPVPALRHGVTPKAVSTFFAEGSGWKIIKLSPPIIQSHSVRFGVVVSDWANTKITYQLYEIGPFPENTSIRQVWKPRLVGRSVDLCFLTDRTEFYSLGWQYVAIVYCNSVTLCDTSQEYFFSVTFDLEINGDTQLRISKFRLVDGHFIGIIDSKMHLWKLQDLQWRPRENYGFLVLSRAPPALTLPLFDSLSEKASGSYNIPLGWVLQSHSCFSSELATIIQSNSSSSSEGSKFVSEVHIDRWTVDLSTLPPSAGAITKRKYVHTVSTPLLSNTATEDVPKTSEVAYSSKRLFTLFLPSCDRWLPPPDQNSRRFLAVVSTPFGDDSEDDSECRLAYLPNLPHWGVSSWGASASLDPHTGQLAYPCSEISWDTGVNEIHVLDFQWVPE